MRWHKITIFNWGIILFATRCSCSSSFWSMGIWVNIPIYSGHNFVNICSISCSSIGLQWIIVRLFELKSGKYLLPFVFSCILCMQYINMDMSDHTILLSYIILGPCCKKQVFQAGLSNCIPQNTVGCKHLCLRYLLLVPKSLYQGTAHPN